MEEKMITVKKFNLKKACQSSFNALIIGKRNTGKSTLVNDFLYYTKKNKFPKTYVFSTDRENIYEKYVQKTVIYDERYVEKSLNLILEKQIKLTYDKRHGRIPQSKDIRLLLVLDEMNYKTGILRSEVLRQIFMSGYYYGISIVCCIQYVCDAPIDLRCNATHVFCFSQYSIVALYKSFFEIFDKKRYFKTVLDACTTDYECLVLDRSTIYEDCCFFYKSKLGSREFFFSTKIQCIFRKYMAKNRVMILRCIPENLFHHFFGHERMEMLRRCLASKS